ncbi:hypothetical protein BJY04DRAFT_225137 [Aspergillus karnatakaensis]|uniref:bZIP transcription factor n=1 Tax=Aspergillus karnatakaensis TaxID=1810916 RepID=UPI003CCD2468
MTSYTTTSSDQTDHSALWASSSIQFTIPQWAEEPAHHASDHSSGDEQYPFPDMLEFPDLRASLNTRAYTQSQSQTPQSPATTISDGPGEDKSKRRREQNRNAQRAYRERKEKYIKNLLKHIDEMNRNQARLSESYETMRQEALRLQDQVEDLKAQLNIFSKAQVVLVKFPEDAIAHSNGNGAALLNGAQVQLQGMEQLDPLLGVGGDIAYPTL